MGTDKRIIDSQNVLGIPCSEILFLDDASALLDDFGKLRFIRNSNDRLNRRIILRFFQIENKAVDRAFGLHFKT